MTTPLNQLFTQIHKLPQIPVVVRDIIIQLNDPHTDVLEIVKNVEKEQLIALKVLRLVNSAHFGLARKVSSIEEATLLIGMSQLKMLVVASGLVSSIPQIANFDIKQFWQNSFQTAAYAKWFADRADLQPDLAYTAGLLSDLGNLLIHMGAPKEANEIDQHVKSGKSRPVIERNRLGYTNQTACSELLHSWRLADDLCNAIAQSAEPLAVETPDALACTVYLGSFMSHAKSRGDNAREILRNFPYQVSSCIGLQDSFISERLDDILQIQTSLDELLA